MQDFLERFLSVFNEFYRGLSNTRKIAMAVTAVVVLLGMIYVIRWAVGTRFEALYTDLNREDAKQIAVILEDKKIPYQLENDGKTIKIPSDMIEKWRLELAMMGVSFSGTVGYEVFDKQSFGTTSFVQKINRQRALEGELVKTIKYIRGVKRARVHLNIPESSPFVAEKKPPTASVVIELDQGVTLTPNEIRGIASLVASSVEGMRNEGVVILDDRGKKLSENIGDPMTEYTANRIALEAKKSQQFEKQVEDILGKVVGDGKVIAKIAVDMDYTESVTTQTQYDNENSAVLSEVKNTQKLDGSRPSPQGIPGARSNLPGEAPQPGIPETKNKVDKELTTRNYNVPAKVVRSKQPTATIKKISAAVMIDGRRVPQLNENGKPVIGKDGKQVMAYEKWSDADLSNFSAIVASTIGINEKRGDTLVIKNLEFAEQDLATTEAILRAKENRQLILNIVKYLAVGLTITLFFFFVVRPFILWVTDNTIETLDDFLPKTLDELEKIQANQKLPGLEEALPEIEEKVNPAKIEGNMLKEKIVALVEADPAKAAQLVHEMIHTVGTNSNDNEKQQIA